MWVTWETPESDGGCPVQEYVVEKCDARKTNYTNAGTVNADTHELQVENVKFLTLCYISENPSIFFIRFVIQVTL